MQIGSLALAIFAAGGFSLSLSVLLKAGQQTCKNRADQRTGRPFVQKETGWWLVGGSVACSLCSLCHLRTEGPAGPQATFRRRTQRAVLLVRLRRMMHREHGSARCWCCGLALRCWPVDFCLFGLCAVGFFSKALPSSHKHKWPSEEQTKMQCCGQPPDRLLMRVMSVCFCLS